MATKPWNIHCRIKKDMQEKLKGSKFGDFEATGTSEKDDDIDEIPTKDDMDEDELEMLVAEERALEAKRKRE